MERRSDEFDGCEIIVAFVQPSGSTWMASVRVRKDGIEPPRDMTSMPNIRPSGEARRAGIEIGRAIVRGIDRSHRLSGISDVETDMATRPRTYFISRFRVVATTTFVSVCPRRFLSA
nr:MULTISPECIES: DUF6566 family protein [Burkholderia]